MYMESMLALINHTHENTGLAKAKLHWSGFCTNTCTQMWRITRLGGSGGMLPQEKFDAVRQLLRPLLGLKTSLGSLYFSLGMATEFASRPHTWKLCPSASAVSGTPLEPGKEVAHESQSIFCYSGSYSKQHPARMCACSQVSADHFYARTAKFFMWAQICVGNMRVSRLKAKGWQHHLSQNIDPVIAVSAGPAPPTL